MTEEEILNYLSSLHCIRSGKTMLMIIMKALEKRIPKEPLELEYLDLCDNTAYKYLCPHCNTIVRNIYQCCPCCGQKLKW